MKGFKFFACSLLMLAFCFTVTAKGTAFENVKTEFVKYQDIQPMSQVTFIDFTVNAVINFANVNLVKVTNLKPNTFATITDVGWCRIQFVNHYAIYKNKLTANHIIDKRKLIESSGIKYKQLSC